MTNASTASAAPPVGAPGPGAVDLVPPPSVPLSFLAAAGAGLAGLGLAVWFAADHVVTAPRFPGVVSAVHVGVLAFLTMAVLGALHQFAPVVGRRPLRSVAAARVTFVALLACVWLLPNGFAHGPEWLVPTAGLTGLVAVSLAAWNLSRPLSADDGGIPVLGLRLSVAFLLATVIFGVVYAFDRQTGWFPLLSNRVLAHAHLGLLGWLGLTYVSVAEKLWPMFLLAHRPSARTGAIAVGLIAAGVSFLTPGLLLAIPVLSWMGSLLVAAGLVAHLVSLASCVKHRRRRLELLHAYLFTSAAFLVMAMAIGAAAGILDVSPAMRGRLVTAEVAALVAWLGLAVLGHAHKIVPFISYTALRTRGYTKTADGRPLLFGDLFAHAPARVTLAVGGFGFTAILTGILATSAQIVAIGGVALTVTATIAVVNLATGPGHAVRGAEPNVRRAE